MKLSNRELVNSIGVLNKLNNMELPIKLSYALSKNITKIDTELKTYNLEREKLIQKYGEKNEEGKIITKEDETINIIDLEGWSKEIEELLECENEIDINAIDLESINADVKITPGELTIINFMFR